jgi:nucleotide-binding universal stress UspA family protein
MKLPGTAATLRRRMKKILIATDGTDGARAAVDVGLELAADEGADVVLARVGTLLDLGFVPDRRDDAPPERLPRAEEDPVLCEAIALAEERLVKATPELLLGDAPKQIARLAEDVDADLIVVGSRRLGRLKRIVLGSTSRSLLDVTRRPVVIVTREDVPAAA